MIILCEPQCEGFEHVEVNSALLRFIRYAFADEKIIFLAERHHLEQVQKNALDAQLDNIEYQTINIPARHSSNLKRQLDEYSLCKMVFNIAKQKNVQKILFCSVTSPGLIAIKLLLRIFKQIKVVVIPHSILEQITQRPSLKPWKYIYWIKVPMVLANNDQIRYLLLGQSIKEQIENLFPSLEHYISSIHLPYKFEYFEKSIATFKDVISFGSFGVGHRGKGTELLFKMAEEIKQLRLNHKVVFMLIGPIVENYIRSLQSESVVTPSPDEPMSREEFSSFAKAVDYAVFFYKPTSYRFTASGALFDAFSYVKPIIAIKNPYFEYYFKIMGDIGYLCDNYEEMKAIIVGILENPPTERYQAQCQNILQAREQLKAEKMVGSIAGLWGAREK